MYAQQTTIDSLRRVLPTLSEGKDKAGTLRLIREKYDRINEDSALYFSRELINLSKRIDYAEGEYLGYHGVGVAHFRKGLSDSALYYFQKSYEAALLAGDSVRASRYLGNVGAINTQLGNYEAALKSFFARLKVLEKYPDAQNEQSTYNNIAATYDRMEQYDHAITYHHKSLKLKLASENIRGVMVSYQNLSAAHTKQKSSDSAIFYSKKSLEIAKKLNDKEIMAANLINIGAYYSNSLRFKFDSASFYLNRSLSIAYEIGDKDAIARSYVNLAFINFQTKNYQEALDMHLMALPIFESLGYKKDIHQTTNDISECLENLGKFDEAYYYLRRHKVLTDSIFNEESAKAISEIQTKFETEKKDQQITLKNAQLDAQSSELSRQKVIRNTALGGGLILIVLASLAFHNYKLKSKSNKLIAAKNDQLKKSLVERESLLKEIHHRVKNNLQVIASLLYLQSDDTEDTSVKKLLEEGQGRVRSMALIHQKLYENDDLKHIPFEDYLQELIGEIQKSFGKPVENVQLDVNAKGIFFDVDTAVPLGLIINELSTNAFKYAFSKKLGGKFKVLLSNDKDNYYMKVSDDGIGIPNEQLNETTSKSLGLRLTRMLSDQLEGEYSFSNDNGTSFELKFAV